MKSRTSAIVLSILLTVTISNSYAATVTDRPATERVGNLTDEEKKAHLEEIQLRVSEIKDMDRSSLSKTDRRALRKELRNMSKEAKEIRGGVYLSVGAIIIIILLLILIL